MGVPLKLMLGVFFSSLFLYFVTTNVKPPKLTIFEAVLDINGPVKRQGGMCLGNGGVKCKIGLGNVDE